MTDWLKLEQVEAKLDGAKSIKNSGRGTFKGDARMPGFTIDYKFSGKSFNITKSVWAKIVSDAQSNELDNPTIKVILGDEDERKTRLWVVDDGVFKEMYEAWIEKNNITSLGLYEGKDLIK